MTCSERSQAFKQLLAEGRTIQEIRIHSRYLDQFGLHFHKCKMMEEPGITSNSGLVQ
jgi:hypothetical protein